MYSPGCLPADMPSEANKRAAITRARMEQSCFLMCAQTHTHTDLDINSSCTGSVQTKVIPFKAVLSFHFSALNTEQHIIVEQATLCICVPLYLFKS